MSNNKIYINFQFNPNDKTLYVFQSETPHGSYKDEIWFEISDVENNVAQIINLISDALYDKGFIWNEDGSISSIE